MNWIANLLKVSTKTRKTKSTIIDLRYWSWIDQRYIAHKFDMRFMHAKYIQNQNILSKKNVTKQKRN